MLKGSTEWQLKSILEEIINCGVPEWKNVIGQAVARWVLMNAKNSILPMFPFVSRPDIAVPFTINPVTLGFIPLNTNEITAINDGYTAFQSSATYRVLRNYPSVDKIHNRNMVSLIEN